VQKALARAGIASRRAAEHMIEAGRVSINGRPARLGDQVELGKDQLSVDGRPVMAAEAPVYILLHKPSGVLSSSRSQGGHSTVVDLVPLRVRLFPVGRLDLESEGLVIMTNDGALTYRLTHPKFRHEKEYRVQLDRTPDAADLAAWRSGPVVESLGRLEAAEIAPELDAGPWLRLILREGKKRQVRMTAEHFGYQVRRLIRVRVGPQELGNLDSGKWRHLTGDEVAELKRSVGLV
jgi:23S rRNA pseudouridine2605 synthase